MTTVRLAEALARPNLVAFLRVIREGESSQTDDAYRMRYHPTRRVLIEGALIGPHPRIFEPLPDGSGRKSSAFGAYQFTATTWDDLNARYGLADDIQPRSQDLHCVALIDLQGALGDVIAGRLDAALAKCSRRWASLPGSPLDDGGSKISYERALAVYENFGGRHASDIETQGQPVAVPASAPDATPAPAPAPEPAPIEERSTFDPESRKDRPMLPAVAWALAQAAATAVPAVAKILFDPAKPVPQRNVEAVGAMLGKIAEATRPPDAPVWTEQQAVEKVTSDPAAAAAAQAALLDDYDRLVGIIQRGVEADDASRDRAAARSEKERYDMLPFLADRAFRLIAAALAIEVGLLAIGFVMHVSNEALMILLTLLVGTLNKLGDRWGQLYDYRIGSSEGSKASGEAVRAIAARRN